MVTHAHTIGNSDTTVYQYYKMEVKHTHMHCLTLYLSPFSSLLPFSFPPSYSHCILNDRQYIIPSFSLRFTVSVHTFPPFSQISPLSDCPVVCSSIRFISMCLCECSELNPPKPQHFNQPVQTGIPEKKIWPTACGWRWEGLTLSASRHERVCSHVHTNACISRRVPADQTSPVSSVSRQRLYSRICRSSWIAAIKVIARCSWLWPDLCKNLNVWLVIPPEIVFSVGWNCTPLMWKVLFLDVVK